MSNSRVVTFFGVKDPMLGILLGGEELCDKYDIKTFFSRYRNPVGIEIEIEGYNKNKLPKPNFDFWSCKADGSLKNSGIEFVSSPLSGRQIDCAIKEISDLLKPQEDSLKWSHRCSIHVHLNITSLTINQLQAFIMLYGLFEDLYFSMAKPERKGNPYCYPVKNINPSEYVDCHQQHKYCAVNLAPIKQFGTVEFRHLHGSHDWKLLRRWIQLIVKLHYYVDDLDSATAIEHVLKIIREQAYVAAFKNIYGATSVLFTEDEILSSAELGAPWSVSIADESF